MQQRYGLQERQSVSLALPTSGHAEPDVPLGVLSLSRPFWGLVAPLAARGGGPAIELFSRRERPGWDAFGNQVVPREDGA